MGKRKDYYVYAHRDLSRNIFYIGKGTGRRAWSKDRDIVWKRYVNERLGGQYEVEILTNNLSEPEAESLECELINEHGHNLVNWTNPGRQFDYPAIANTMSFVMRIVVWSRKIGNWKERTLCRRWLNIVTL